ncbi:hypothetical protein Barb4_01119 [Bacteroidales bacterium Barb4]|nr:hypothetical protein Barb4_01119 [Bacteroidales bacterium Barb4]
MKYRIFIVLILSVLVLSTVKAELKPNSYFDCVVAIIGIEEHNITKGTGFLFGKRKQGVGDYDIYLVTNKHVLQNKDNSSKNEVKILFNSIDNMQGILRPLKLVEGNPSLPVWTGHADSIVDIAVIKLNDSLLEGVIYDYFKSDKEAFNKEELGKNVSEGDDVYILGFPFGFVGVENKKYVILRNGVVSRIQDFFDGKSSDFIVDAFIFHGNSGSPVILRPKSGRKTKSNLHYKIIGVAKGRAFPEKDKNNEVDGNNTGLCLVESVNRIFEAIERAEKVKGENDLEIMNR